MVLNIGNLFLNLPCRLYKSSSLQPVQTSRFSAGDSVKFFKEALVASLAVSCQGNETDDRGRSTAKNEVDAVVENELMFAGVKSVLNLIQSPMFCKLIFKFYHLKKFNMKVESCPDSGDSHRSVISTDAFQSFFKQVLQLSLLKSPLNEMFDVTELERCLSILLCHAMQDSNERLDGKINSFSTTI